MKTILITGAAGGIATQTRPLFREHYRLRLSDRVAVPDPTPDETVETADLADIDALPAEGANVRLCKGIYIEPRPIAWKGYETVRENFVAALEKLIARGVYVAIATHDEYLVCAATALIDRHRLPRDRYEFQMLLGVDPELRRILLDAGHRLRVYVPYGADWYPYSVRRLRENPEIALHVINALLGRRGRR